VKGAAILTLAACAALGLTLSACQGSGILAADARAIADAEAVVVWAPGSAADVPGLYSSLSIEGPAAAVLAEVHYRFDASGAFTGAALVTQPEPTYTVLSGAWRVEDGRMFLSEDGEPALLEVAGDRLRMSGAEGVVVLHRRSGV
jgi:hypothetical protein